MSEEVCTVEGCTSKVVARGLCARHYKQYRRNGEVTKVEAPIKTDVCLAEGCTDKAICKGYCNKHYRRFKKYGTTEKERPICKIPNCGRYVHARGLCQFHYRKALAIIKAKKEKGEL